MNSIDSNIFFLVGVNVRAQALLLFKIHIQKNHNDSHFDCGLI